MRAWHRKTITAFRRSSPTAKESSLADSLWLVETLMRRGAKLSAGQTDEAPWVRLLSGDLHLASLMKEPSP